MFLQDLTSIFLRENFKQEFSEKRIFFLPDKIRNFLRSLRNSYNNSETKMSKTQNKTKISSLLSSRTYNTPTQKEKNGRRQLLHCCCIFEENLFFFLKFSCFLDHFEYEKFSSKQHPSLTTVHLKTLSNHNKSKTMSAIHLILSKMVG